MRLTQVLAMEAGSVAKRGKEIEIPFTYEVNRFVEPGADVRLVIVLHRDALVLVVTLKMVRTIG